MNPRFLSLAAASLALLSPLIAQERTLKGAQEAFARIDRQLNDVYQEAKENLHVSQFDIIQKEQREWIDYRDAQAESAAFFNGNAEEGKEKENVEYWNALSDLTETRIQVLRGWLTMDEIEDEWEGVWIDGYGGQLLIEQHGEGAIRFAIHVVRGPTHHIGALGGTAKTNDTLARFTITPEGTDEETWLTFFQQSGRLEVVGANTTYYHGARAYFGGKYIRIGKLTEEDRKRIESPEF